MRTYIVDSFTNEVFKGNPAGVCILNNDLEDDLMLKIAQELNLSETAFIKALDANHKYSIRYFSPKMEIPLCGHATLASSKVIFNNSDIKEIGFTTVQNINLNVLSSKDEIVMEFPVYDTITASVSKTVLEALGIATVINCEYNKETNILLLEIPSQFHLSELRPDFEVLYKSHDQINGVLVTASSDKDDYDFHSRYFWPWSGTNEDPVTGATHTFLAKYWGKRLKKNKLKSFQSSSRSGFMDLELIDENNLLIKGQAVIVLEGDLII